MWAPDSLWGSICWQSAWEFINTQDVIAASNWPHLLGTFHIALSDLVCLRLQWAMLIHPCFSVFLSIWFVFVLYATCSEGLFFLLIVLLWFSSWPGVKLLPCYCAFSWGIGERHRNSPVHSSGLVVCLIAATPREGRTLAFEGARQHKKVGT